MAAPESVVKLRSILAAYELPATPRRGVRNLKSTNQMPSSPSIQAPQNPKANALKRDQQPSLSEVASGFTFLSPSSRSPQKRLRGGEHPTKKLKTDTYAHLQCLTDRLTSGLDVVFCGINPGVESAVKGAHYAHYTNQFWKGIYDAGLTTRLVNPLDESILPAEYSLGLTDIVQKPTAEAAELTKADFYAGVPILLSKLGHFRPRIVCMVGKCIWDNLHRALRNWSLTGASSTLVLEHPHALQSGSALQESGKSKSKRAKKIVFEYGLQPFKLVHSPAIGDETLLFVMPSTSGLVALPKYPAKVALLKQLKEHLADIKAGRIVTATFSKITFTTSVPVNYSASLQS